MSTLVGLREAFLPRFAEYVNVDRASSAEVARLRSQAGEILNVARDLDAMVKKLDPTFASAYSEVQIESVRVATERAFQSEATVRVFDIRGAEIDRRALVRRLEAGTCDLRRVLHDMRVANGMAAPLSKNDEACGLK